jgi:hypothetical protein
LVSFDGGWCGPNNVEKKMPSHEQDNIAGIGNFPPELTMEWQWLREQTGQLIAKVAMS